MDDRKPHSICCYRLLYVVQVVLKSLKSKYCVQQVFHPFSGGHNGVSHLRSVECFNPVTNEWTIVAPMSRPRTGLSVAVLNGLLYAVGGHDGSGYLNLVQCHDPVTNSWFDVKTMCSSRCSFGIATI